MSSAIQVWNPDDWERFALSLLQSRHGALSVHKIPATHKGDFGIDFYCTEKAVAYQCYAVQEPIDIAARAKRQKVKITTDLNKIIKNVKEVSKLFLGNPVKYWVLLAPLHDSKDINIHCSNKTIEIRNGQHVHLDPSFEVGIHDQGSFDADVVAASMALASTVALKIPEPTSAEISHWEAKSSDLLANANRKLVKRTGPDGLQAAVVEATKSFLQCSALLDALRIGSPDLHENVMNAVMSQTRRLNFAGPQGGPAAGGILNAEIDSLVSAIQKSVPNLNNNNTQDIALGTVSEWVFRCPLDFPSNVA